MSRSVTLSGRIAHLLSTRTPRLMNAMSRRQAAAYEKSGGAKGGAMGGKRAFRLTVVGRKSGEPRSVMLMLIRRGDDLLVCGSQGGSPTAPQWWKNLMAAGGGIVQVGGDSYEVDAREITDPAERPAAWADLVAGYPDFASYQQLTDRVLPIAVLTRRP